MPPQSRLTGAVSLVAAQAVILFLGYITHLWVGRVLGPAPYGIYGIILSLQSIVGLVLSLGVPMAVSRFVAQDKSNAQNILSKSLKIQGAIALTLTALTLIFAPVFSRLLSDTALTSYVQFVAIMLFFQAFHPLYIQFLSGMHRFNRQAALTSIYAAVKLAGAISLLYFYGVYGAFAGFAIGGMTAAVLGWYWTRNLGGTDKTTLPSKSFLSFAGIYMLILLGLQILMSVDLFMVKSLMQSDIYAGYYNAAVTISRIPYFLLQGLTFILLPSVSALIKPGKSHKDASDFISKALRYLIALVVPGVALGAMTASGLITLFFTSQYLPASDALTVLIVGLGGMAFYLLLVNIVAGAGKARIGLVITTGLVVLSVILGYILIPLFGLIGAAWQTTITSLIGLSILSAYTFKAFSIPVPFKSTINIVLASIIAILPLFFWQVAPLMLPLQYILLGTLYLLALGFLGEITPRDRYLLASAHPKLSWLSPKNKPVS